MCAHFFLCVAVLACSLRCSNEHDISSLDLRSCLCISFSAFLSSNAQANVRGRKGNAQLLDLSCILTLCFIFSSSCAWTWRHLIPCLDFLSFALVCVSFRVSSLAHPHSAVDMNRGHPSDHNRHSFWALVFSPMHFLFHYRNAPFAVAFNKRRIFDHYMRAHPAVSFNWRLPFVHRKRRIVPQAQEAKESRRQRRQRRVEARKAERLNCRSKACTTPDDSLHSVCSDEEVERKKCTDLIWGRRRLQCRRRTQLSLRCLQTANGQLPSYSHMESIFTCFNVSFAWIQ